jgi:U3 small nucleolar RNA-associated protein 22
MNDNKLSQDSDQEHEILSQSSLEAEEPQAKKQKLFKAATIDEMIEIRETSDLFKSNMFKLQIEELLKCNVHYDITLELKKIKTLLDSIKDVEEKPLSEFDETIPANLKCAFKKPSKIAVVGSYLLKTVVKSGRMNIDLGIEMPTSLFQEKDYVNNRYFFKRRYYLSVLEKVLKKHYKLEYLAMQNDIRRCVLVLQSNSKNQVDFSKKGYTIRIIPYIDALFFTPQRLGPGKNNLRTEGHTCATPQYNNSILQDQFMVSHMNLLHSHIQESPSLKDAIVLGKVWLEQRGFGDYNRTGYGFNGFIMSMIMAWLLRSKSIGGNRRIGKHFSSYQMIKIAIDLIAKHDFALKPLYLTDSGEATMDSFGDESFLTRFDVAIVDPSGTINLAGNITRSAMEELQYEARLSCGFFKEAADDRFEDLFLKNVNQEWLKYDNVFRIPKIERDIPSYTEADALNYSTCTQFMLRKLYQVLKAALGDRVLCIAVSAPPIPTWKVNEKPPTYSDALNITVGLVLHPENSLRVVEIGPKFGETEKIQFFRDIWGPRAESRRFQDGTIAESVMFDCDESLQGRALLVARMTAYLFDRHFKVDEDCGVTYWAGLGNKYLKPLGYKQKTVGFQSVMDAFIALTKELRALDLPLSIYRLVPISESLRYCSVFIPQPIDSFDLVSRADPAEFLIEFEFSSRWPDNLNAIETMKRAFYIRIVTLLEEIGSETAANVTVGERNEASIDFVHSSGHHFRAKIHHSRVGNILEKRIDNANPSNKNLLEELYEEYLNKNVRLARHSSLMSTLCLRYPFLGSTIRLTKRWLSSHLLLSEYGCGLSPQVVELLCARVYSTPTAFGPPSAGWTGFVRLLDLLQSWKWGVEPLIVELEAGMITSQIQATVHKKFQELFKGGSNHIPMYIATELDMESKWWKTLDIPVKVIQRIVLLARTTLRAVEQQLLTGTDNDISVCLF